MGRGRYLISTAFLVNRKLKGRGSIYVLYKKVQEKVDMNGIWDTLLTIIVTAAVILIPTTCFQVTNDAIPPTCKHLV